MKFVGLSNFKLAVRKFVWEITFVVCKLIKFTGNNVNKGDVWNPKRNYN